MNISNSFDRLKKPSPLTEEEIKTLQNIRIGDNEKEFHELMKRIHGDSAEEITDGGYLVKR